MKIIGIILILIGVAACIYRGIGYTKKEKIIDAGPIEITKETKRTDGWQLYAAGGISVLAGIILVLLDRNKKSGA